MKFFLTAFLALLSFPLWTAEVEGEAAVKLAELPIDSSNLMNTAIGLAIVLALILGLAWGVRRFGGLPSVGKGVVSIIGGISLGPRERAVLLQVGHTRLLVGVSPGRIQTLHVLEKNEWEEDASGETASKFEQQLSAVIKGRQP